MRPVQGKPQILVDGSRNGICIGIETHTSDGMEGIGVFSLTQGNPFLTRILPFKADGVDGPPFSGALVEQVHPFQG